ncbi:hypothetical protein V6N13_126867 [Hibiscus sabdariffa]
MNATGPNGPIGMDASHSDGSEVSAADLEAPVDVGLEQLNEVDGNEADGNEVDGNETDGNEEARDEQHENGVDENEADLVAHPRFELGMIFENSQQFKEALYAYAVGNRFDFKFVSNKKEKVRVVCKGKGCPFVVHVSRDKYDGCFKVKTLVTDHNCSVTFKNSRANFKFVGKHFISKLMILPTLRLVQMIKLGKEELNVELNKKLCFRARKWALEKIRGSVVHEFHRLWDYVNTLRAVDVKGFGDGDGDGCTMLSDMQKCCKATTQSEFAKYANRIGKLKGKAYDDLMEKDPIRWSKAFFSTSSKCDAVDNNFSEAFNSAIIGARFKSIISMIEKKLEEHKKLSSSCHVIWNVAEGYEVVHGDDAFVVDVREWTTTCRVWDLIGIPCPRAVCVILYKEEPLNQYLIGLYKKNKSTRNCTVLSCQQLQVNSFGKIVEWERLIHLSIEKCQVDQNIEGEEKKVR